ncbi:hypothetical protein CLOM_g2961 [Closterium sp. NIES-68]|nr:hypothetical protein CLOM_g16772 [Closterium sp. NIES-68]GJP43509.1 hypothetical protein CLOM_g2961 [Closterium sp. NIES-68]GJP73448.1 hypothetical protein CLOP_g4159 [Closterium sp. NIES-67]
MGLLFTKISPIETIEQAKKHRAEPVVLSVLRENLGNAHHSVTLFPARGAMSHDRLVYSGDLSAEDFRAVKQIRPLLRLEYLRGQNAANIRHGLTGEVLMMVVTEASEGEWNQRSGLSFRCGPETEARVYSNGLPVGINISSNYLAISPPPVQQDGPNFDFGPSMVELVKTWENRALVLSHRDGDGFAGTRVAAFTQVGGHRVSVFRLLDGGAVDPIVAIALSWFNDVETTL